MKLITAEHISIRVAEFILTRKVEELNTLTRKEIAEILGLDSRRMIRAFESDQHIALERFIVREKMYRSFFLIEKNHGITIKELAKKMGFLKIHDFVKEFKRYLFIHPGKYLEICKTAINQV